MWFMDGTKVRGSVKFIIILSRNVTSNKTKTLVFASGGDWRQIIGEPSVWVQVDNKCTRFNNHRIIDLFRCKVYGGPRKGDSGIVNCNPRCTYCLLVPKQDTFYVTDGSP